MKKSILRLGNVVVSALLSGSVFMLLVLQPGYAQTSTEGDASLQRQLDTYLVHQAALGHITDDREGTIQNLTIKWEPVAHNLGIGGDGWLDKFTSLLSGLSDDTLAKVSNAETWGQVQAALDGVAPANTGSLDAPADLGNLDQDLVYYSLKPCRIVDTRFATQWGAGHPPVGPNSTINVWTRGNRTTQGGAEVSSCGVGSASKAVVINVTAVPVAGNGHLRVYPFGDPLPTSSLVNYKLGTNIANAVVQSQCRGCTNELTVFSLATAHVVIDVIGYFAAPETAPLEQVIVKTTQSVAHNVVFNFTSPACPAGYTLTGGGCHAQFVNTGSDSSAPDVWIAPATKWKCGGRNFTSVTSNFTAIAVCSRTPGR